MGKKQHLMSNVWEAVKYIVMKCTRQAADFGCLVFIEDLVPG